MSQAPEVEHSPQHAADVAIVRQAYQSCGAIRDSMLSVSLLRSVGDPLPDREEEVYLSNGKVCWINPRQFAARLARDGTYLEEFDGYGVAGLNRSMAKLLAEARGGADPERRKEALDELNDRLGWAIYYIPHVASTVAATVNWEMAQALLEKIPHSLTRHSAEKITRFERLYRASWGEFPKTFFFRLPYGGAVRQPQHDDDGWGSGDILFSQPELLRLSKNVPSLKVRLFKNLRHVLVPIAAVESVSLVSRPEASVQLVVHESGKMDYEFVLPETAALHYLRFRRFRANWELTVAPHYAELLVWAPRTNDPFLWNVTTESQGTVLARGFFAITNKDGTQPVLYECENVPIVAAEQGPTIGDLYERMTKGLVTAKTYARADTIIRALAPLPFLD